MSEAEDTTREAGMGVAAQTSAGAPPAAEEPKTKDGEKEKFPNPKPDHVVITSMDEFSLDQYLLTKRVRMSVKIGNCGPLGEFVLQTPTYDEQGEAQRLASETGARSQLMFEYAFNRSMLAFGIAEHGGVDLTDRPVDEPGGRLEYLGGLPKPLIDLVLGVIDVGTGEARRGVWQWFDGAARALLSDGESIKEKLGNS